MDVVSVLSASIIFLVSSCSPQLVYVLVGSDDSGDDLDAGDVADDAGERGGAEGAGQLLRAEAALESAALACGLSPVHTVQLVHAGLLTYSQSAQVQCCRSQGNF